jgi:S1-C subfamily serine protease
MSKNIPCPHCGNTHQVPDTLPTTGTWKCPRCGKAVSVTAPSQERPPGQRNPPTPSASPAWLDDVCSAENITKAPSSPSPQAFSWFDKAKPQAVRPAGPLPPSEAIPANNPNSAPNPKNQPAAQQMSLVAARRKRRSSGTLRLAMVGIALVLLVGGGIGAYWVIGHRTPGGNPSPLPSFVADQAGAALMASEARIWTLEGQSLKEAQEVFTSPEAQGLLQDKAMKPVEKEHLLRSFLRAKRSAVSLHEANSFIETLNSRSRDFLASTASLKKIRPGDLILEWLTYEAAIDLTMMASIWQGQGNFRAEATKVVDSFLEGVFEPPALEKGVSVESRTKIKIVINLFGARVIEEIIHDKPARMEDGQVVVCWKSNYNYLRGVMKGENPKEVIEEKIGTEGAGYSIDYLDWIREYLKTGDRQPWATAMYEESALAIGAGARDDKIRAELGRVPGTELAPRKSLQELYVLLAPSVPVVKNVGLGSGSGFLVIHQGKYLVVTNKHMVENASRGIELQFILGKEKAKEETFTIPASETSVTAIRRTADIAIVDVNRLAGEIEKKNLRPLSLASASHLPQVGEDVFTIGHPGQGESPAVRGDQLTGSLTKGIVSAVNRESVFGKAIQMTVPTNWGNSGGPLFDYEGRVVGVTTFGLREHKVDDNKSLALEGLNFSVEISHVHELLTDPGASLKRSEIAAILQPKIDLPVYTPSSGRVNTQEPALMDSREFRILPRSYGTFTLPCQRMDTYFVGVDTKATNHVNFAVYSSNRVLVATAAQVGPNPDTQFRVRWDGNYVFVLYNPSATRSADVRVRVYKK